MQVIETTATPPEKKSVLDFQLGRPLSSDEDFKEQNRSDPRLGVPAFGLDAVGSAGYGPEAALTILIPLGLAGVAYTILVRCRLTCANGFDGSVLKGRHKYDVKW